MTEAMHVTFVKLMTLPGYFTTILRQLAMLPGDFVMLAGDFVTFLGDLVMGCIAGSGMRHFMGPFGNRHRLGRGMLGGVKWLLLVIGMGGADEGKKNSDTSHGSLQFSSPVIVLAHFVSIIHSFRSDQAS